MSNPKLKKIEDFLVKNIIKNIKVLMDQKSISIYEMEKTIGKDNLRPLMIGRTKHPNIILIYEIAQKLGVTIEELIKDSRLDDEIIKHEYQKSPITIIEENTYHVLSKVQKAKLDLLVRNMMQNIQILMSQQSISVYKIEKIVGLNNLADFFNGKRKTTSVNIMYKIAQELGVTIGELLKVPINMVLDQEDNNSKDLKTDLMILEEEIKNLLTEVQKLRRDS